MFKFIKTKVNDISNLNSLVDCSDNGTAFCYGYFLKLKNVDEILQIFDEENNLLCIFPLFENGTILEQSTIYVPYGNPIFFLNKHGYRKAFIIRRKVLEELMEYLKENYTELCFSFDTSLLDIKPLVEKQIIPEARYTYKINLKQPYEQIKKEYGSDRKKDIKRAIKNNLKFVIDDELKYFDITKALVWEKKYDSDTRDFVEEYLNQSIKLNKGKVFVAMLNNQVVGGVAITYDLKSAYIMYSYYEHNLDLGIIAFLYDNIIKFLQENTTIDYLDFEGSVFKEIEAWNLSFGAKQWIYFNFYWQQVNNEEIYKELYDYGEK